MADGQAKVKKLLYSGAAKEEGDSAAREIAIGKEVLGESLFGLYGSYLGYAQKLGVLADSSDPARIAASEVFTLQGQLRRVKTEQDLNNISDKLLQYGKKLKLMKLVQKVDETAPVVLVDHTFAYTKKDVDTMVEILFEEFVKGLSPAESPQVVFMGGYSGAGKNGAADEILEEEFAGNAVILDIDDLRALHPRAKIIAEVGSLPEKKINEPSYYANQTGPFAWDVAKGLKEKFREQGYNTIINGTLRDAEPIIEQAKEFKARGYATRVQVVIADKDIAWQRTKDRFARQVRRAQEEKNAGIDQQTFPREVSRSYFDLVISTLPGSVTTLNRNRAIDQIRYKRKNPSVDQPQGRPGSAASRVPQPYE